MGQYQDNNPDGKTRVGGWLSTIGGLFSSDKKENGEEKEKEGFFSKVAGFFGGNSNDDKSTNSGTWQTVKSSFGAVGSYIGSYGAETNSEGARLDVEKMEGWIEGGTKVWNGLVGLFNGSQTRIRLTKERIEAHVNKLKRTNYSLEGVNVFMHDMNKLYEWEGRKKHSANNLIWNVIEPMTKGLTDMGFERVFVTEQVKGGTSFQYPVYSKSNKSVQQLKYEENKNNVFVDEYANLASSMQSSAGNWIKYLAIAGGGFLVFKLVQGKRGKRAKASVKRSYKKLLR